MVTYEQPYWWDDEEMGWTYEEFLDCDSPVTDKAEDMCEVFGCGRQVAEVSDGCCAWPRHELCAHHAMEADGPCPWAWGPEDALLHLLLQGVLKQGMLL